MTALGWVLLGVVIGVVGLVVIVGRWFRKNFRYK